MPECFLGFTYDLVVGGCAKAGGEQRVPAESCCILAGPGTSTTPATA